jgi:catechol 2,3-dioxygenase-like lactoylglutathione lyase family enzyme
MMLGAAKTVGFIPSKDRERSEVFYRDILGLRLLKSDAFASVFEAGGRTLRISDISSVSGFEPYPFTIFGWEVDAMRPVVEALSEAGVAFERYDWIDQDELGIWTTPSGNEVAWFRDPDANILSLSTHPPR